MTHAIHPDLNRWLDAVTDQLPPDVAVYTRNELVAHYEDAVDKYCAEGLTSDEAHTRAMADLGGANMTACGLKDAHLGHKRYLLAMAASLLILLVMLLLPVVYFASGVSYHSTAALTIFILFDLLLWGLPLYVMLALKQLFAWRYDLPQIGSAIGLSITGLTIQTIADIASLISSGYSHNISGGEISIFQTTSVVEAAIHLVSLAGFMLLGVGLLRISGQIFKMEDNLYRLGKPLAGLLMIIGTCSISSWLWLNIPNKSVPLLIIVLLQLAQFLMWSILTLLFFRAVYRPANRPVRLA